MDFNSFAEPDQLEFEQFAEPEIVNTDYAFEDVAELDKPLYFAERERELLGTVSPVFGRHGELGTGTRDIGRGIINWFLPEAEEETDFDRLRADISRLQKEDPELANSPEGIAYQNKINGLISQVMDADEIGFIEGINALGNMAWDAPAETLEMFGEAIVEDPLLALLIGTAYRGGSVAVDAITKGTGISRLVYRLSQGTNTQRMAAQLIQGGMETAGVMGAEASVGYMYEVGRNLAIGNEPTKNAETMAAIGAALGGSTKGLATIFKAVTGYGGTYKNTSEAIRALGEATGLSENEIVKYLFDNIYEGQPLQGMSEERINLLLQNIPTEKQAAFPGLHKHKLKTEFQDVFSEAVAKNPKVSYVINKKSFDPVSSSSTKAKVYVNPVRMAADYENRMNWMRGLTAKGEQIKNSSAAARREAFKDFDFDEFQKWIARKGQSTAYSDFLMRFETNVNKAMRSRSKLDLPSANRIALMKTLEDLNVTIGKFKKRGVIDKTVRTLGNVAAQSTIKLAKEPERLWRPIVDVLRTPVEFGLDLTRTIKNRKQYNADRLAAENLLRDWEGSTHTLDIKAKQVENWVSDEVPSLQRREALYHYLEGDFERYRKRMLKDGVQVAPLTGREVAVAKQLRTLLGSVLKAVNERNGKANKVGFAPNYVPHIVKEKPLMTETELMDALFKDSQRGLNTKTTFTRDRKFDTAIDLMDAGYELQTRDIGKVVGSYLKSMQRAEINKDLIRNLRTAKTGDGHSLVTSRDKAPPGYVEFRHSGFKDKNGNYAYVNPNIAPDLRLYFDTSNPSIARRMLSNVIQISKRIILSGSGFHIMALAWSGMNSGLPLREITKTLLPLDKIFGKAGMSKGRAAVLGGEGHEHIQVLLRNGLQLGLAEELRGDALINALRGLADTADNLLDSNKYSKAFGKVLSQPVRGIAKVQEGIDNYLWDRVATGLKATNAIVELEKRILKDAAEANKTGRPLTDLNLLAQRAAQYTNDAYGNQNWAQMAMNVQSAMGHRLAAALNRPTTREYIRMAIFAPDWTFSNFRVIAKNFMPGKEISRDSYNAYLIRSALLFAFIGEALQQSAGQGSLFDDSLADALRPDLGDGKQVELSKQFSEVLRLGIYGPEHVLTHKLGTLPKALMEANSLSDIPGEFAKQVAPISLSQGIQNGPEAAISGMLGVPIYDR